MSISMYTALCATSSQRCVAEAATQHNSFIYADYATNMLTHEEFWRITTATGLVLSNITDVQRHSLWDYLRDPYTGELWQTLRPEWDAEGLCVCWEETYRDRNMLDHTVATEWRPNGYEGDNTCIIDNLKQCVAFAIRHNGVIMMRNVDDDGCMQYTYYNFVESTSCADAMVRVDGRLYGIVRSDTPIVWEFA